MTSALCTSLNCEVDLFLLTSVLPQSLPGNLEKIYVLKEKTISLHINKYKEKPQKVLRVILLFTEETEISN